MGLSKSSAKGNVYSNTSLPQETREKSNKQPNFTPKATRKRRNEEPQCQQRKEIFKIRAEIMQKKQKRAQQKSTKPKAGSLRG